MESFQKNETNNVDLISNNDPLDKNRLLIEDLLDILLGAQIPIDPLLEDDSYQEDRYYLPDPRYYFLSFERIPYIHYVTSENIHIKYLFK